MIVAVALRESFRLRAQPISKRKRRIIGSWRVMSGTSTYATCTGNAYTLTHAYTYTGNTYTGKHKSEENSKHYQSMCKIRHSIDSSSSSSHSHHQQQRKTQEKGRKS